MSEEHYFSSGFGGFDSGGYGGSDPDNEYRRSYWNDDADDDDDDDDEYAYGRFRGYGAFHSDYGYRGGHDDDNVCDDVYSNTDSKSSVDIVCVNFHAVFVSVLEQLKKSEIISVSTKCCFHLLSFCTDLQ